MDRNVKIALGCGGAGCLGLIVVLIAVVAVYLLRSPSSSSPTNRNSNFNYNSNRSSRTDSNGNNNDSSGTNENDSSTTSSSSLSEDDKHKLFHAASVTSDPEVIRRVGRKIGILKDDFSPTDDNVTFATEHVAWAFRNTDFIQSMDTPAKARAYVDQHIND